MTPMLRSSALAGLSLSALVAVVLLSPPPASGSSSGAIPGVAGNVLRADGSVQTCTLCHTSFAANSGTGSVALDLPETAAVGTPVRITVTVDNQTATTPGGTATQGFQATVRDPATGDPNGTLALVDASLTKFSDAGQTYVTHTSAGIQQSTWTFDWTPGQAGTARVYVAGNAANGNSGSSGDHVYTETADVTVAAVDAETDPEVAFRLEAPRPNPVRAGTPSRLSLRLAAPGTVAVRLVDVAGRTVRQVSREMRPAGDDRVRIATDDLGAGTYFVVVDGPGGRRVQPLSVVR